MQTVKVRFPRAQQLVKLLLIVPSLKLLLRVGVALCVHARLLVSLEKATARQTAHPRDFVASTPTAAAPGHHAPQTVRALINESSHRQLHRHTEGQRVQIRRHARLARTSVL